MEGDAIYIVDGRILNEAKVSQTPEEDSWNKRWKREADSLRQSPQPLEKQ